MVTWSLIITSFAAHREIDNNNDNNNNVSSVFQGSFSKLLSFESTRFTRTN